MMEEKVTPARRINWYLHRVRKLGYVRRETIRNVKYRGFVSGIRVKAKYIYCIEDYVNIHYRTIDDISYDEYGE